MNVYRFKNRELLFNYPIDLSADISKNLGSLFQNDIPVCSSDLNSLEETIDGYIECLQDYRNQIHKNAVKSKEVFYFYHPESDCVWFSDTLDDLEMNADACLSHQITEEQYYYFEKHGVLNDSHK